MRIPAFRAARSFEMAPLPVVSKYSRGLGGICGYTVCVLWQGVTSFVLSLVGTYRELSCGERNSLRMNVIEAVGLI